MRRWVFCSSACVCSSGPREMSSRVFDTKHKVVLSFGHEINAMAEGNRIVFTAQKGYFSRIRFTKSKQSINYKSNFVFITQVINSMFHISVHIQRFLSFWFRLVHGATAGPFQSYGKHNPYDIGRSIMKRIHFRNSDSLWYLTFVLHADVL